MKKSLVLMAMAGVALASCVNNEVVDVPQKEQEKVRITFDKPVTYSNVESRVNYYGEIGEHEYGSDKRTYPKEEQFKIFAVWDNKPNGFDGWPETPVQGQEKEGDFAEFNTDALSYDFFVDSWAPKQLKEVVKDGQTITEEQYYYWPGDKYLSFSAVSPSDLSKFYNTKIVTASGKDEIDRQVISDTEIISSEPTISYGKYEVEGKNFLGLRIDNFETPSNPVYHYDLLFSQLAINNDKATQDQNENASHYSGLPVKFQHALSCVRFSFVTDEDEVPVYLQGITLTGARTKGGHFAENIILKNVDGWDDFVYDRKGPKDTEYNVDPTWTFSSGTDLGQNTIFKVYEMGTQSSGYNGVQFTGTPTYVEGRINTENGDKYYDLFLMPQTLENVTITVSFKVGNNGAIQTKTYSLSQLYHHEDVNQVNAIAAWEIGKRYAYRLYYSQAAAKKDRILFSPGTDNWTDVEGIVVDLAHSGTVVGTSK